MNLELIDYAIIISSVSAIVMFCYYNRYKGEFPELKSTKVKRRKTNLKNKVEKCMKKNY